MKNRQVIWFVAGVQIIKSKHVHFLRTKSLDSL